MTRLFHALLLDCPRLFFSVKKINTNGKQLGCEVTVECLQKDDIGAAFSDEAIQTFTDQDLPLQEATKRTIL